MRLQYSFFKTIIFEQDLELYFALRDRKYQARESTGIPLVPSFLFKRMTSRIQIIESDGSFRL